MENEWYNNRISKKLNIEYPRDFSICDIDGAVRFGYYKDRVHNNRFIIYESKNELEKPMGKSQLTSLKMLSDAIDWTKFDEYSGVFVFKIIDLENEILWYDLQGNKIRTVTFKELYNIFSGKL
jgi:hypothetical protein